MYSILIGTPPIKSFPDDDKIRVVWAQTAVIKNLNGTTNVPNVEIMLKEVLPDGTLSEMYKFVYIAVSELDIVRPMTIWKGNKKTEHTWNKFQSYRTNIDFSFDFDVNNPESIKFSDKRADSKYGYFPPYVYKFSDIKEKAKLAHCLNSRFTKLTTVGGTVVLIPSLEFFTYTYTPHEKIIRNKLLQFPLDETLNDYINSSNIKDRRYYIELKRGKVITNEAFLAYAKFNQITRFRLQILRNSLEVYSDYPERYPVVLPYHPHKLDILADGIWLDKETFFAFRINNYSLPTEHSIVSLTIERENNPKLPSDDEPSYRRYPQELEDDDDISLGHDNQPHVGNGSRHIISEVGVLNANNCNIEHEIRTVKTEKPEQIDFENTDDIDELSSSESTGAEEAKNIGKAKIVPKNSDKSHLRQSDILNMVKEALVHMIDEKVNISTASDNVFIREIYFVDEDCILHTSQMATQFSRVIKSFGQKVTPWVKYKKHIDGKREFTGYRNYLLIKIVLTNGKFVYLFEIDRKDDNESFLGLVFNMGGAEVDGYSLNNLLSGVMDKTGRYVDGSIGVNSFMTFKHYEKDNSMISNIKNTLARANSKGLFV